MKSYIKMETEIFSLGPLDGRYRDKTLELRFYFSEAALFRYRMSIECLYLESLLKFLEIDYDTTGLETLTPDNIREIKEIEKVTKHDVKAVEVFIRNRIDDPKIAEMVHFGLTSQDVNSSSYMTSIRDSNEKIIIPDLERLVSLLNKKQEEWSDTPMLSRTHGQPASPTTLSKEILVFIERLQKQISYLKEIKYYTKFGGAVGNFNSHYVAYPEMDWIKFGDDFVESMGLNRNHHTTQIDHYDNYSEIFDLMKRISTILIDFCRDVWSYISQNYFVQKVVEKEIGSSAMPHKINPINFENAEGNLMIAVSFFEFMSRKLPVSRLQRDLTDSTVLRNIGTCYGYFLVGVKSLTEGIRRLEINKKEMKQDLENNKIVLSEAIQSILRREGFSNSYTIIKFFTRGKNFNLEEIVEHLKKDFDVNSDVLEEISNLKIENYIGKF